MATKEAAAILLELLTAKLGIKPEAQPHVLEILTLELETLYNKAYMQGKIDTAELAAARHRKERIDRLEGTIRLVAEIHNALRTYATVGNRALYTILDNASEDARRELEIIK